MWSVHKEVLQAECKVNQMTHKALQITQQLKQTLTCDAKNIKTKPTASGSAVKEKKNLARQRNCHTSTVHTIVQQEHAEERYPVHIPRHNSSAKNGTWKRLHSQHKIPS